ncbi:MAG TPA: helix-turn-helix domain-containing protein [Acidimicrobiales bacterium]|nr:helix-turn-helix domain-containing protein [Acidimicrobiales bacterium]
MKTLRVSACGPAGLIEAYRAGMSIEALRRAHQVSRQQVESWLAAAGEPLRVKLLKTRVPYPGDGVMRRLGGRDASRVAEELGVSLETARRWLVRAGAAEGPGPAVSDDELIAMYLEEDLGLRAMEARTGLTKSTISKRLRGRGVEVSVGYTALNIDPDELVARKARGESNSQIARELGVNERTIRRYLQRAAPSPTRRAS